MNHDLNIDFSKVGNKGPELVENEFVVEKKRTKSLKGIVEKAAQYSTKQIKKAKTKINDLKVKISGACLLLLDKEDGFKKVEVLDNGSVEKTGKCLLENFSNYEDIDNITAFEQITFRDLLQISKSTTSCSTRKLASPTVEEESCKYRNVYVCLNDTWYVVVRKDNRKYLLSLSSFFKENKENKKETNYFLNLSSLLKGDKGETKWIR